MSELPQGWEWINLDNIALFNPRHPSDLDSVLEVSFVPMPGVSDSSYQFNFTETRELGMVKKGFTHFAENDVLIAKITPSMENGKAAIARKLNNRLGCGTTELHVIRPQGGIFPEYIYHFIHQESFRKEAAKNMTGTAGQLRVPAEYIKSTQIPLPPLNEQRRIVAKLEKLLAKCEASKQRLDKIPSILKRFRQSILAAACSGRLTADWRAQNPDVETASELLKRIQLERKEKYQKDYEQSRREGKRKFKVPRDLELIPLINSDNESLPLNWCFTSIRDVADCLDSLRVPVNKDERAKRIGEIPYYGANGQVGWIDDYIFDENLVAVVEDETFVGRDKPFSYIIRGKSWVNNHAHVLKPVGSVSVEYLNICLSYYDFVPLTSGTTGRRKLVQSALLDAEFAIAPIEEQTEIVQRVQKLFKLVDQIEQRYQKARVYVDKLPQSILAKAFRGELVPQDPTDEPASVLLDRIRAEREQQNGKAQSGKKRRGKGNVES